MCFLNKVSAVSTDGFNHPNSRSLHRLSVDFKFGFCLRHWKTVGDLFQSHSGIVLVLWRLFRTNILSFSFVLEESIKFIKLSNSRQAFVCCYIVALHQLYSTEVLVISPDTFSSNIKSFAKYLISIWTSISHFNNLTVFHLRKDAKIKHLLSPSNLKLFTTVFMGP